MVTISVTNYIQEKKVRHPLKNCILNPIETKGLVIIILEALDQLLKKYWSVSSDVGLIATLLDPRFKKLGCFNNIDK